MDVYYLLQIATAVMVGNAASFAFFMAAMKCLRLQSQGVKDDELPWWVYVCLIVPPLLLAYGFYLLP